MIISYDFASNNFFCFFFNKSFCVAASFFGKCYIMSSLATFVHPSVWTPIRPSERPFVSLGVHPSVGASIRQSGSPSIRWCVHPFVWASIRRGVHPSVGASIRPLFIEIFLVNGYTASTKQINFEVINLIYLSENWY